MLDALRYSTPAFDLGPAKADPTNGSCSKVKEGLTAVKASVTTVESHLLIAVCMTDFIEAI